MVVVQPCRILEHGVIRVLETPRLALIYQTWEASYLRRCRVLFQGIEDIDAIVLLEAPRPNFSHSQRAQYPPVVVEGPSRVEVCE